MGLVMSGLQHHATWLPKHASIVRSDCSPPDCGCSFTLPSASTGSATGEAPGPARAPPPHACVVCLVSRADAYLKATHVYRANVRSANAHARSIN